VKPFKQDRVQSIKQYRVHSWQHAYTLPNTICLKVIDEVGRKHSTLAAMRTLEPLRVNLFCRFSNNH